MCSTVPSPLEKEMKDEVKRNVQESRSAGREVIRITNADQEQKTGNQKPETRNEKQ